MDVKPKTAGPFYRDDAAQLVSAAATARQLQASAPSPAPAPKALAYAEPVLDEPARAPLKPEAPINQNRPSAPRSAPEQARIRRTTNLPRLLARIVIAPFYVLGTLGAVGVIALFAKGFFGL